jgi:hypothetical protein
LVVVSCPAANRNVLEHRRDGAIGVFGRCQRSENVVTRRLAPVLEIADELVVEPRQRVEADQIAVEGTDLRSGPRRAQYHAELLVVLLRHAQHVGDDQQRERLCVGAEELALARGDEVVETLVGEAPHEVLVLLESARGQQPVEQRAGVGVVGRIHGDHVLEHRHLRPVGADLLGDVVTFGGER